MSGPELRRRQFLIAAPAVIGGFSGIAKADPRVAMAPASPAFPNGRKFPLHPKPFWQVTLKDDFWAPRIAVNQAVSIPFEIAKLKETERGLNSGVLQAAIYTLRTGSTPAIKTHVEQRVRTLIAKPSEKGVVRDFEVAAAYYEATGDRAALDWANAVADAAQQTISKEDPPYAGAEREALDCVALYNVTANPRHLAMAKRYLDVRGRGDAPGRSLASQSYLPVTEQHEAVGHAVNGVTLMLSLIDVGVLTGERAYFDAGYRMWTDIVTSKLYVTGGVGCTGNEGFGKAFSLPNISAYSETCAVLMFQTLNHHLYLATGDARYIDVMERGMYNNALDGVSHSGDRFFYVNRLASAGDGRDERWNHASLECCPPNLVRFLASMPGLVYAQDEAGAVHVNLYVSSEASFDVGDGQLGLSVESGMPWNGDTRIAITTTTPLKAPIRLRIPGWARGEPVPGSLYTYADRSTTPVRIAVNGAAVPATVDRFGYVTLDREWRQGDTITIALPMEPRRIVADSRVREDAHRFAVERGPIVYCAEWPEAPGGHALDLVVAMDAPLGPSFDKSFFGGAMVIDTVARHAASPAEALVPLRLIPYHLWANRGPGEMTTWLLFRDYEVGDIGPAGGYIFYDNPQAARDGWRYLEAAPFDQSQGAHWGCFRHDLEGARGTAIGTGKQNTADMLIGCAEPGNAAQLCASFTLNGVRGWFLPARDELAEMYRTLKATGIADFRDAGMADNCEYWASTQVSTDMAVHLDFADNGLRHGDDKDFPRRVRAIRTI